MCRRVLKPSGHLFLSTNTIGHMQELYAILRESLVSLGQEERLPVLEAHIAHERGSIDSVTAELEKCAFKVVGVTEDKLTMRFATEYAFLSHYFMRLGFMGGLRMLPRQDAIESTFRDFESRLNRFAEKNGGLNLSVPMVCIEAQRDDV